jgi:hypothetical protein
MENKPKKTISAEHMKKMRDAREFKRQLKLSQIKTTEIKPDIENNDDEQNLINIKKEIAQLQQESELDALLPKQEELEEDIEDDLKLEENPKKKKGQSRERMMELHRIRSEKANQRRKEKEELKAKEEEVKNIRKEIINSEYEEAQKIKQALEAKKAKKTEIKDIEAERIATEKKEVKHIYKTVSRDILKDKYLEEAKRRVMIDLFS